MIGPSGKAEFCHGCVNEGTLGCAISDATIERRIGATGTVFILTDQNGGAARVELARGQEISAQFSATVAAGVDMVMTDEWESAVHQTLEQGAANCAQAGEPCLALPSELVAINLAKILEQRN